MNSTFKLFLKEEAEQNGDIGRIISAVEKQMPRLLGSKIYRYGGKSGVEATKGGAAYLYFFGSGKAFRVRTKSGAVVGFDIWKSYSTEGLADYSIDTSNLSVSAVASELKQIAKIVKSPEAGKFPISAVKEAISVSYSVKDDLFEAKSVSAEEFLKLAQDTLSAAEIQSVTFDQIVSIAKANDVAVPNKKYLDDQKVGRGRWTLIPGGGESKSSTETEKETSPKAGAKADPILYIKVTAQDPVSKKFISAADNKQAQQLYAQIKSAVSDDREPTKAEMRDVDTLYGHLFQLVTMACKSRLRSLLIYGGPGTGKTYTIMEAIKTAGLVKGKDYVKLSGKATAIEIYKTLFMFRKGGLILFDDLDSMWKDKDASNFLKAALDTSPVREISAASGNMINVSKMSDADREKLFDKIDKQINGEEVDGNAPDEDDEDGEKPEKSSKPEKLRFPSTFEFTGRVVFISNLKKDEFDSAILSRSAKIDMSLTPEETLVRMRSILPGLGGTDVSIELKEELLAVLLKMHQTKEIDQVTMREFTKGLDIVRSGAPNWHDLIKYS
jgi:hypothetical protein